MPNLVFVYGSLRKGFTNNHILEGARFRGVAKTYENNFQMRAFCYGYPAVSLKKNGSAILGEVYEVSDWGLARLDRLEGHPHFYRRKLVSVKFGNNRSAEAYIYLLPAKDNRGEVIESGDWAEFKVKVAN